MSKKVLLNERVKEEELEKVSELVMFKALRIVEQKREFVCVCIN